jgi:hypothetical protein
LLVTSALMPLYVHHKSMIYRCQTHLPIILNANPISLMVESPYSHKNCPKKKWYFQHISIMYPSYIHHIYLYYPSYIWWYTYPSEKWWSSSVGIDYSQYMESHKIPNFPNFPNHQPDFSWHRHVLLLKSLAPRRHRCSLALWWPCTSRKVHDPLPSRWERWKPGTLMGRCQVTMCMWLYMYNAFY